MGGAYGPARDGPVLSQFINRAAAKTLRDEDKLEKELKRITRQTSQNEIGKKPEVTIVVSRLS